MPPREIDRMVFVQVVDIGQCMAIELVPLARVTQGRFLGNFPSDGRIEQFRMTRFVPLSKYKQALPLQYCCACIHRKPRLRYCISRCGSFGPPE